MKKTLLILILLVIFVVTVLNFFPYGDYILNTLQSESNQNKEVKVNWTGSRNAFPSVIAENFTLTNPKGDLLVLDSLKATLTILGNINFSGENKAQNMTIKGRYNRGYIVFQMRNYHIPDFLESNIGIGVFNVNGDYNTKTRSGDLLFNGNLSKIPTPLVNFPIDIKGTVNLKSASTDIKFDLTGEQLKGNGRVYIVNGNSQQDSSISGFINAQAGLLPIKLIFEGTPDNIKIKPSL